MFVDVRAIVSHSSLFCTPWYLPYAFPGIADVHRNFQAEFCVLYYLICMCDYHVSFAKRHFAFLANLVIIFIIMLSAGFDQSKSRTRIINDRFLYCIAGTWKKGPSSTIGGGKRGLIYLYF